MSSTKLDVLWSPVHHDKFIVWGSDITLYEVARLKEIEKKTTLTPISARRGATAIASQSGTGVRCVDIAAIADQPEPLLALGLSSGRVQLTSLRQTYDPLQLAGREFVARYPRQCNAVSWSPLEPHLLSAGMDKHRSEHCLLLWDVHRSTLPTAPQTGPTSMLHPEGSKPLAEMVLSETAHSVSWSSCSNRTLVASTNLKYIKIFDLRDLSNKAVNMTTSRYCYGACFDPWSGWMLASRGEQVVCVWDVRAIERPLLVLPQPRTVTRVMWCPTRRNLLVSLQRESTTFRLHSLQAAGEGQPTHTPPADSQSSAPLAVEAELEEQYARGPSVIERDVAPGGVAPPGTPIAACSWHPSLEARLLAVCSNGSLVEHTVCERVTVSWGATGLVWGGGVAGGEGGAALRGLPMAGYAHIDDIAHVMRRRAQTDYGLKPDLWQNADLADDEVLSGLWHFLALSKSLVEDGCIRNSGSKHPGVRSVLRSPTEGYRSEMVPSLLPDLPSRRVTVYRSVERTRALQLCGWGWGWENAGAGVERMEAEGTPCRAAALAAFHLRLRAAIDVLARANEPQLRVVALALAGLSEERLWREAVSAAAPALPDGYLRALLHFLAASVSASPPHQHQPDLSAVLNETEMRLEDRVAFACIFLSDTKLHEYIKQTTDQLVEQGDLSGILLTGASPEGVTLLQRWVEQSGDVQTAALVAARCFTADLMKEPRVSDWLHSYRNILDAWRLWWARCALDTWCVGVGGVEAADGGAAVGAGAGAAVGGYARRVAVAVACTYCGKPVAAPAAHQRQRPAFARLPPPAAKMKQISSCPNCRKPLPRCGVCGLHLGTLGGAGGAGAPFAGWFSWCGACSHAGHAQHLLDWFKEHTECPVSSCNCHCSTLDPPDRGTPPDRERRD